MKEIWSESDSRVFIEYGKYFIPYQEKQIEIICNLISDKNSSIFDQTIVDLCCGQGRLTEALLEHFENAQVIALDASPTMLREVEIRLANFEQRLQIKQCDLASPEWREFSTPISAFVSSLAIHHLDEKQKKELFTDLYRALAPEGALLISDLILPLTKKSLLAAAKHWDEITKIRSIEFRGNLSAFDAFHRLKWNYFYNHDDLLDTPSPIFDQLKWLEAIGFKNIEVFWMVAGHAIYGGYK